MSDMQTVDLRVMAPESLSRSMAIIEIRSLRNDLVKVTDLKDRAVQSTLALRKKVADLDAENERLKEEIAWLKKSAGLPAGIVYLGPTGPSPV